MVKHAAPGLAPFIRDLVFYLFKFLIAAAVIGGGVYAIINYGPDWFGGGGDPISVAPATTAPTGVVTLPPTTRPVTTLPPTTVATLPTTTTTTLPLPIAPSELTVLVLNSTTKSGIAARATATLDKLGYQMLEPDNYEPILETSRVWYTEGMVTEAHELAAQFPDARVEPYEGSEAPAHIVVVLGTSYTG